MVSVVYEYICYVMSVMPVNIDVSVFRLEWVVEVVLAHRGGGLVSGADAGLAAAQPLQPHLLPLRVGVHRAAR